MGNREDADSAWGKRRMQWRQTLGTEFAGQWNLRATRREESQITGRGKGIKTGRRAEGESGRHVGGISG